MVCLKLRRGDREQLDQRPARRAGWVLFRRADCEDAATCFTARPALDAALVGALVEVETS
jgi:hypothetical protein